MLYRYHVPRWLSAGALLISLVLGLASAAWSLSDGATQLVELTPRGRQESARQPQGAGGRQQPTGHRRKRRPPRSSRPPPKQHHQPTPARCAAGGGGAPAIQCARLPVERHHGVDVCTRSTHGGGVLTFFALASATCFRNKLLRIAGTSLERRKITIHVLEDITNQIQRYLLVQVFTSVLVGVATGLAYWALGLENAAVWGVVAGVLNLAPYIGSALVTGASALVAFLQFGSFDMALAIGGASLVIHTIVGDLLTPWLTSRTSSMSPVAVFVSVLAWGWLWGLWGLLLGIPVMMAVKAVCDRVEDLKAVGELLSD